MNSLLKSLRQKIQTAPALQGLPITRYTLVGLVLLAIAALWVLIAILHILQFVLESMAESAPVEQNVSEDLPYDQGLRPKSMDMWADIK